MEENRERMVFSPEDAYGNIPVDELLGSISAKLRSLGLNCDSAFLAHWALSARAGRNEIMALGVFAEMLRSKYDERLVSMLMQMSRIPTKNLRTFDSFDESRMTSENRDMLSVLRSLSFMEAGTNVVIYGDEGTGKTHIAQAIGNESCANRKKALFYRAIELKAYFRRYMDRDRVNDCINALSNVPCLIVDEIDKCSFDQRETQIFFQIIDRKYEKQTGSLVMTSNRKPSEWKDIFSDIHMAKCIMDRIFDRCINIEMRGESFRGRDRQSFKLSFGTSPFITGLDGGLNL